MGPKYLNATRKRYETIRDSYSVLNLKFVSMSNEIEFQQDSIISVNTFSASARSVADNSDNMGKPVCSDSAYEQTPA